MIGVRLSAMQRIFDFFGFVLAKRKHCGLIVADEPPRAQNTGIQDPGPTGGSVFA